MPTKNYFINLKLVKMARKILLHQFFIRINLLFFYLMLLSFQSVFSQENVEIPLDDGNEWFAFYEDKNVILSSRIIACFDPAGGPTFNYVFISLENKVEGEVLVQWHYDLYNSSECFTCNDPENENNFWMTLQPGETIMPDCWQKSINSENGTENMTLAIYLGKADSGSTNEINKVVLSQLMTNISN